MSEWCQNKMSKKTQSQIRSKGAKYYQSNKALTYLGYCVLMVVVILVNEHRDTCMNAVGFIDKQVLPLEDAWYVQADYTWNSGDCNYLYYIINKNRGIKQQITQQQAQTTEDIEESIIIVQ